jgi:cytochrome c oxidase cbb3-type subunit 3
VPTSSEKHEFAQESTTGHEWDGIQEFDNPLPRWWLWVFYACIVWSIGYWIIYPAWPLISSYTPGLLGSSALQRANLVDQIDEARQKQAVYLTKLESTDVAAVLEDKELSDFARAGGKSAFGLHCSQCHGSGAAGAKGYPNLNDDDWLWGGDIEAIHTTIQYGIRSTHDETRISDMPAFLTDELLEKDQINDVAEYVLSLSGNAGDAAAAERGKPLFAENCAACHGEDGGGGRDFGAPNLKDAIWLYGGDKATVVETISRARKGVMPAWEGKLDPVTIKSLAVYVYSLGGGE